MLKLHLREIGPTLSDPNPRASNSPDLACHERDIWRDSSYDLQQGLDVVELSVDVLLCDLQDPPSPLPPDTLKRP